MRKWMGLLFQPGKAKPREQSHEQCDIHMSTYHQELRKEITGTLVVMHNVHTYEWFRQLWL